MSRIEKFSDLVFIAACVAVVGIVTWSSIGRAGARSTDAQAFGVGDRLENVIPRPYQQHEDTFLVLVHSSCRFCTESMPFYRQLRDAIAACRTRSFAFVSREAPDVAKAYLAPHDLGAVPIQIVPVASLRNARYPSVLKVDRTGQIAAKWQGMLSVATQSAVLAAATCRS